MSDTHIITSTPVTSHTRKRVLSSPEFLTELKKQCNSILHSPSSDPPDSSCISSSVAPVEMDVHTVISPTTERNINLTNDDLKHIADVIQSSFEGRITDMITKITDGVIKSVHGRLDELKAENETLKYENDQLRRRVFLLEMAADSAEQYSRRNNIRISGIPETKDESTDEIVLKLANAVDANITLNDIDRSHRVGKKITSKPRDIIVKMSTYRSRKNLLQQRKLTKHRGYDGVFLNEDLTRARSKLYFQARGLTKSGQVLGAWTSDGAILIKDTSNGIHRITTPDDLVPFYTQR